MGKVTLGLSAILAKDEELKAASDAFKEDGYTAYGLTYEDSCNMSQEDGETQEFFAEEEDEAIDDITKPGGTTFNFSLMDPTLDSLKRLFGGEIANKIWGYPDVVAEVEASVIIKPRKGLMFHISRGKVKAKFNGQFSKKGLMLLDVSVKVRKPNTTGVKRIYVANYEPNGEQQ